MPGPMLRAFLPRLHGNSGRLLWIHAAYAIAAPHKDRGRLASPAGLMVSQFLLG
jgi:hypothetical protein